MRLKMTSDEQEWLNGLLDQVGCFLQKADISYLFAIQQKDYSLQVRHYFSEDTVSEITVAGYEFGVDDAVTY